jgi:hypothetical protein
VELTDSDSGTAFESIQANLKKYDSEMFLGRLAWYNVTELSFIDHAEFCKALVSYGLDTILPPAPRPSDVFKRACTASQRKKVPTSEPRVFNNYMIREVGKDVDNIWRHLVREQVDTEGHVLSYEAVYELHFFRPTITVKSKRMGNGIDHVADDVVDSMKSRFKELDNLLTPMAVRHFLRKTLEALHATTVRPSGGVYFLREDHATIITALEDVIGQLPVGSSFHSLPLIDDTKQRSMLKRAFEDESIGEVDSLLGEIAQIIKGKKQITADKYAEYKVEYDRLRSKVADYSDLLDEAMEATASRLEIMNDVLFDLVAQVKA